MRSVMWMLVALCACDEPPPRITLVDAPRRSICERASFCNPLAQLGCNADERCTMVVTPGCIYPGCVLDGSLLEGEACVRAEHGNHGAYDDCAKTLTCHDGRCRRVCDVSYGPGACAAPATCVPLHDLGNWSASLGACVE